MEGAVPALMDISNETQATPRRIRHRHQRNRQFRPAVPAGALLCRSGGAALLNWGWGWDQHNNLKAKLTSNAKSIDKPIAGAFGRSQAVRILARHAGGLGGRIGRMPAVQRADGRDHNATGFSMWMAGGGVKGGYCDGATDEHGTNAVDKKGHINDLHATMLYLLGLDHTKLTYQYSGRETRLTDLAGTVSHLFVA